MESLDKIKPLSHSIGAIFSAFGIISLLLSYYLTSQVMAFIGLGLSFWGALFFLITPTEYVEGNLLVNTLSAAYSTTERIIKDLNYKGKAIHIPPYPEGPYIPEHLKELKELVAYIPKEAQTNQPPSLDALAQHRFLLQNPKGILLTPPGLGLLTAIEHKTKTDFTKLSSDEAYKALSTGVLNSFSLAKEIRMTNKQDEIIVHIKQSLYGKLYSNDNFEHSINLLGCPIVSCIACALTKSSAKPICIEKIAIAPDGKTINAHYKIIEA